MNRETHIIDREIVESARVFGQWLNQMAYVFAKNQVGDATKDRSEDIKKLKAKILRQIELDTNNAETSQEMIYRTYMRIGKALQDDVPAKAAKYLDAINSGDKLTFKEARRMLIMYMRMRNDS